MSTSDIAVYTLLVFSLLVLVKVLLQGDDKDKRFQKIFGGIIVLTVALISENAWVIGVSLFIGGLIVASEDFMKFLAAIMRTTGDKVPETIGALQVTQATEMERDLSIESEVVETQAAEKISEDANGVSESVSASRISDYGKLLPKLESGTLRYIFKYMDGFNKLKENITFGSYVFDGFTTSKRGRPYFLEVKIFPNITNKNGKILARQVSARLKLWLPKIVSAFDSLSPDINDRDKPVLVLNLALNAFGDLSAVKEEVKKFKFHKLSNRVVVKFQFLNLPDLMEKGAFADTGVGELSTPKRPRHVK